MTIDEAIKHCEEVAEAEERSTKLHQRPDSRIKGSGKRYLSCLKCAEEHRQLAEWLRELKELREQTRWIPCSERLPNENGKYFVMLENREGKILGYSTIQRTTYPKGFYYIKDGVPCRQVQNPVVAWMPLPEPYKTESEGNE